MSQAPSPPSATSTPSTHVDVIILRHPSSYGGEVSKSELNKENVDPGEEHTIFEAPTIEWMEKTWAVTHSTLHMWRNCKNVKITYQALGDGKMSDLVENTVVKRVRLFLLHQEVGLTIFRLGSYLSLLVSPASTSLTLKDPEAGSG